MGQVKEINPLTKKFLAAFEVLKEQGLIPPYDELMAITGIESKSTISNILAKKQNIQPGNWKRFSIHFGLSENSERNYFHEYIKEKEGRRLDAEKRFDDIMGLLKSNLADLLRGQQIIYSFVRAGLEYQISVANNDDEQKEKVDQIVVSTELGENMKIDLKQDKALSLRK